jgi:hypothetical protein
MARVNRFATGAQWPALASRCGGRRWIDRWRNERGDLYRSYLCREIVLTFFDQPVQFGGRAGMLGVDGNDLPQTLFALGVVGGERGQPGPGVLVARLGNQDEMKHLAGFVGLAALRGEDGLAQQVFSAHSAYGLL